MKLKTLLVVRTMVAILGVSGAACSSDPEEMTPITDGTGTPYDSGAGTTLPVIDASVSTPVVSPPRDAGVSPVSDAGSGVRTLPSDSGAAPVVDAGGSTTPATTDAGPVVANPGTGSTGGFIRGPAPTPESTMANGPFKFKSITTGYWDGPGFADATLYWPTDAEPPFASLVVVPGFVSAQSDIQEWGPFMASHGIVAMTIGTNLPTDDPDTRAKALIDALDSVRRENMREGSELKGKLDVSRQATMGWSMGGGGSLLVAEQTPSLKAAISMCGYNPGHNYSKIKVPSLLFAAQGDTLAGGQSQGFYSSIADSVPKLLWESPGEGQLGGHYMYNTPKNQNGLVGRYGLSWMKVYLEEDVRYKQFLVKPMNQTDFKTTVMP
jgi:dienelactone hydrolase